MVDCEGVSLASSCTKLPHSRSAEISKTPPPGAGPKGGGKMLAIRVHMLDDNITLFQVQAKAVGRVLFEQVCKQLHLLEADYFGLEYQDHAGIRYWLDLEKQLSRQVGLSLVEPLLHFCVKFYTPDPAQLEEEFTRYLFCLQVKRDMAQGHLQCNDNTAALMASYIVQAECGDYSADDYPDHTYLSSYKFVQHQDRELEKKIMENHKKHVGQSPAEADLNLLETARRCELYGMKMHPAKDHEGVPLNLAVAHMGIAVFQNYTKIYTFSWAKVRKISFKRKKFLIKLHPDGYGYYKDVVEFFFESRNECKNLWKKCVENHGFFRCNVVKRVPRQRTRVLSRGSSFRYSGKTQKQMVEFVRENYVKRQNFQRSQSFRQSSSVHSSVATNVGGNISARPLIPLGDNSIVSVSCGSMVHVGAEEGSQSRTFQPMTTTTNQTTAPRHTLPEHTIITPGLRSYNTASSQTDIVDLIETSTSIEQTPYSWQRSASAKELRKAPSDASHEPPPKERNFIIAGSKTPSFDREAETKVYSSSYPGTTSSLSTESADELEPGGSVLVIDTGSSREFSHDDLSHDSYELLERENFNYVHSRSCSIGSSGDNMLDLHDDELFVMDDVQEEIDKRAGYVEPKYRDMAFNEFNEKCKEGIAKFRERLAVEFGEYEAKCKPGSVIGYDESEIHYPVERTKSEPFVSDFWKIAKQHRKLFHQKSFDFTPTESINSEDRAVTSKSTADIPYAVHRRQQMNGTTHCYECRSPVSPRKDDPVEYADRKNTIMVQDRLTQSKHDADLNSHDSGLSLSLVGESIDDLADRNNQFLKPNDQRYIKELKPSLKKEKEVFKFSSVSSDEGSRNKNLLIKSKAQSADSALRKVSSFDRNPPVEVIKIPSQDGEGIVICSTDDKNISLDTSDPDVIIVEYHSKRKRAFQKRSSSDGKGSFDKDKRMGSLDSAQPDTKQRNKFKDWRSESSSSCDNPALDFKRERFSKEVKTSIEGKVVRETREEKELKKQKSEELEKKKTEELRKQKSEELQRQLSLQKSEELQKKIERRQEVIDALKRKHEDLNKIEIIKVGKDEKKDKKPSRLAKPMQKQENVIELSPKPEHKELEKITMEVNVEINATQSQLSECSEDEIPPKKSAKEATSPVEKTSGPPKEERVKSEMGSITESIEEEDAELETDEKAGVNEQTKVEGKKSDFIDSSKIASPELVWKKFGELPPISSKRERSPILFARLGFSEGSTFAPAVQSPSSSRRAKSLDAPVVSLQRLPPVTSFSSRDDTVDNEEGVELEEKTLRSAKAICRDNIIEEEDVSSLSPLIQDANKFVKIIENDSSQVLPDVVTTDSSKDVVCQPVTSVVPSVLENYSVVLPPRLKMHPDEIIIIEQDQKIPEVTLLSPSYKSKPYADTNLSDEQKVPESHGFEGGDSGGPSEINDDDDSSFLNDVFDFSDSRKGSDVTDFSLGRDNVMASVLEEPEPRSHRGSHSSRGSRGSSCAEPPSELTERRPSTRQERLDSFKNTKSYSVDISTESEDNEGRPIPTVDVEDWDQDDEAFANECVSVPPPDAISIGIIHSNMYSVTEDIPITFSTALCEEFSTALCQELQISEELQISDIQIMPPPPPSDAELTFTPPRLPPVNVIPDIETTLDEPYEDKEELILPLSSLTEKIVEPVPEFKSIPPKRSFDDDVSSSSLASSIKPDKATLKPFSLESSGSSSLEEGIFPPDDCSHFADEEEGSSNNSAKDDYQSFGYQVAGAELVISGYSGGGVFGLSRTLSRISERSTTSEQERSDFDDDLSTKPSSRSMSVEDESMMSSDRQPSLSSDPSSTNPEIEEQPLPPLPPEPLGFNIPPPLLQHDEEWPSPPNSSFDTPVISNVETYYMDMRPEEPQKITIHHEEQYDHSSSDSEYENKTLQEEDGPDSSTKESTVKLAVKMKKAGNSSDTSLDSGITTTDTSMNARNTNHNHVTPMTKINGTILPTSEPHENNLKTNGDENLKSEYLDKEAKKKRTALDKAYFIGKELLMTERTYKRDLELINLWAREAFSAVLEEPNYMTMLLKLIDPIDEFHAALLKDMEYHISSAENRASYDTRLADLFCNIVQQNKMYDDYIAGVKSVLHTLAADLSKPNFDIVYATFEKNKVCYLPLSLFILKPLQRLLHYSSLLDRVIDHYDSQNAVCPDLGEARAGLTNLNKKVYQVLAESENYVQLIELSRDLSCFEGKLIDDDRTFIRQGCLTKFSQKKGYQQRMFFLLSDMMLYCNLVGQKFKVHGQLPLRSLTLEEREDNPSPNSFTMYSEKRAITVCGSSQEEKNKWLKDISIAVEATKRDSSPSKTFFTLKCANSSESVNEKDKNANESTPQRSNTTVHVCWHRNTSVCLVDHIRGAQNQLSGYLLRKFKNSNGWQKLWVVFTNFCLFFYKTFQDEAPLASLPLLGYSVTVPSPTDGITKDYVFKLQFKNHEYFFRAESQYTFDRWMEVISSAATQTVPKNNQHNDVMNNID